MTTLDGATESSSTLAAAVVDMSGPSNRNPAFSVAIDPIALVVTECITVTSAMRKHQRWAHSSVSAILGGGTHTPKTPPSNIRREKENPKDSNSSSSSRGIELDIDEGILGSRWGLRGKKGESSKDNPLMAAFARLRSDLKQCPRIQEFATPALLQPFLQVIRSSSTTAPITSLALIAITKMLAYGIINPASPGFGHGMQLLASTVTHCRFEGDNSPSDEVVFLRILKLMEDMITGTPGEVLGDASVCEMMECALSICCHLRMSEVLRRSAEISMVTMCQTIFFRLKLLEGEFGAEPGRLGDEVSRGDMEAANINFAGNGVQQPSTRRASSSLEVPGAGGEGRDAGSSMDASASTVDLRKTLEEGEKVEEVKPYGLPSIRELFRVLADLLDPHDKQRTDTLRVMALRIVNVALEVAGPSIANHPSLASLAKDTLCRNLFQLVRSENIAILHESLRVAGTLLATCRSVLKLQQELFLSYVVACLHPRVPIPEDPTISPELYQGVPQAPALVRPIPSGTQSGRSTPVPVKDRQKLGMEGGSRKPDAREAMVESVGALVRIPSFMPELFANYDCEIDRSDLCIDMVGLLARNAFPDSATWSTTNVPPLCLDSLLGYVQCIADRLHDEPKTAGLPSPEQLQQQRARKKDIIRGATKFNESPKGGIVFLASQGIIPDPNDAQSVASFLKGTTRVDKKVLGEFISKKNNEGLLEAFLDQFDFKHQRLDEALRQLLNSFRLPGESALIERIVSTFSEKYFDNAAPAEIVDKDAVFVLTYAIIMLNTDLYNPNVKNQKRMTVEDFAKNLRGVNGGGNFDQQYLQDIYDAIKNAEIVLPEEHDNKHAFEHAWKELLVKTATTEDQSICNTNIYDGDMFAATWRPVVATLNYVFVSATDDAVFSRVISGYQQCAAIAAKYGNTECLDHVVWSLAQICTLAKEDSMDTKLNTEVQAQGRSIMVSKFAVEFGRDQKAELATLVLFRIINGVEGTIRKGWMQIVRIIVNLFVNSLIPTSFTSISRDLDLPPIPLQSPAQVIERNDKAADSGLFSAFTSYVSSVMNDDPPEPNDQEIEATLVTVDCINACRFEEILGNVSELSLEGLKTLTEALLQHVPGGESDEDSSPRVIAVKPSEGALPAPTPLRASQTNGSTQKVPQGPQSPTYDPALVYVLELATILALRDDETITVLGEDAARALQRVIRDADALHPVALSRSVFYLLSLLRASNDHGYIRAPVILHSISSFKPELLKQCAHPILKGIQSCVSGPAELKKEMATSPDFWAVLRTLQPQTDVAGLVFGIVEAVASGSSPAITADNYEDNVKLLDAFASAGSIGAQTERNEAQHANAKRPSRQQQSRQTDRSATPDPKPAPIKKPEAVARGTQALSLLTSLTHLVPTLIKSSQLEPTEAWHAYWTPLFTALVHQSTNPCREIRQQALASLQSSLLRPEITSNEHTEWTAIFSDVLIPLINALLKPEVYSADATAMSETRVQAAQLLCKIFLHYLQLLSEWQGVLDLWSRILTIMDRLMNSGLQGDVLVEAVPESLKNVLFVMASGDLLKPPPPPPTTTTEEGIVDERSELQKLLWGESVNKLERFLPGLMNEVFPQQAARPAPVVSGQRAQQQQVPERPASAVNGHEPAPAEAQAA
ncbi:hypothetical protein MBLNU230_g2985t1 [Neophaeotheca triangularis]